jgi:NAD(P)-dependent dehydrogenase (short-subunit alcohol dehydrogenase family)
MADNSLFDLAGRVALVTGGNGGIGRAIALTYARAGAAVAIIGRNRDKNAAMLAELQAFAAASMALDVDLLDRAQLKEAVSRVESQLGPLSILVNNAGAGARSGLLATELADWDRVLETNLTVPFILGKYAAESMVQRRSGKIINIASLAGFVGHPSVAYSASKAGLQQLTRVMAAELGPYNVQVNAIAPGWIETDMALRVMESPRYPAILEKTPAGRFGQPNELAGAAMYLASSASDFTTGTTIVVDGGLSIGRVG